MSSFNQFFIHFAFINIKFKPWPLKVAANISQLGPNWSGLSAGQLHL